MNIYEIIAKAQALKDEKKLDSVSPSRVGALIEDTLKYINEYQLLSSSPSIHKTYASVSAMQADAAPVSDLTGKAMKKGQLVVIVPTDSSDATAGDVYRYDGPSGNTSAWTFISKIGGIPADAQLSATSTNPVQNAAVTAKLTELESKLSLLNISSVVTDWIDGYYIDFEGNLVSNGSYSYTRPILLRKEQTIAVRVRNYLFAAISLTDKDGSYYSPLVMAESGSIYSDNYYEYTATEDCYVALSGYHKNASINYEPVGFVFNGTIFFAKQEEFDKSKKELENIEYRLGEIESSVPKNSLQYSIKRNTTVLSNPYGELGYTPIYDSIIFQVDERDVSVSFPESKEGGYALYDDIPSSNAIIGQYIAHDKAAEWNITKTESTKYVALCVLKEESINVDFSDVKVYAINNTENTEDETEAKLTELEFRLKEIESSVAKNGLHYSVKRDTTVLSNPYGELGSTSFYDTIVFQVDDRDISVSFPESKSGGYALYSDIPSSSTIIGQYIAHDKAAEWNITKTESTKYVALCVSKEAGVNVDFSDVKVYAINEKEGIYCGINIVEPIRTLTGREEWFYKDSIVAGLNPLGNFNIRTNTSWTVKNLMDYSSKAMQFRKDTEGVYPIVIRATDADLNTTEKEFNVVVRDAPEKKLKNRSKLRVIFFGDSLIYSNMNLIGHEWLRMLNTSDQSEVVNEDGSVSLPTLNMTDGKIRLYGEQEYYDGAPYTMAAAAQYICERTNDSGNPFYNPNSSQPNELGEDGINKRVDFGWWFDNNIGQGEYPDLVYIATGPNDFANIYDWSEEGIEPTVKRVVAICKKIKSVCDSRAGGDSGVVIKIIQHQPYPVQGCPVYNFPPLQQRVLWQKTIVRYAESFIGEGISHYAEVIPCASRFDVEFGYTLTEKKNNVRYNGVSDALYTPEGIHMNRIGAFNYADVLVTDFIADERFD